MHPEPCHAATPRPLRLEYLDPSQLDAHPMNWKLHPAEQLGALEDFISEVGWAGALLLNERTNKVLDGHGRRQLFAGRGPVPVLVGNWTEEQERKILRSLDPTGWMARVDGAAFELLQHGNDLLPALDPGSERLQALHAEVRAAGELFNKEQEREREREREKEKAEDAPAAAAELEPPKRPSAGEVPDAIWPTDNAWGVPVLLPELQADAVEFPVLPWGCQGQTRAMRGTWVFYVADSVFGVLWQNPAKVLPSGAPCLVEPNFSTSDQTPLVASLWTVFKRRWLARYWQSQGRRVFVDLNVHHSLLVPRDETGGKAPALLGVPEGWKAYATRAHANRPEMLVEEYGVARAHAGGTPLFLVYGGGKRVQELAREHGWVWVAERHDKE